MKNFSIVLPSRGRPMQLKRLLDSLVSKTCLYDEVEVLVGIDNDDNITRDFIFKHLSAYDAINLKLVFRQQSSNLSNDYYNALCRLSTGKYLWVMNDDCEIMTQNWDVLILEKIRKSNWKIFVGVVNDSTRSEILGGAFSCFPMLSREAVDAMGYFFHPEVRSWAADKMLHRLYENSGRMLDLTCVDVKHHWEKEGESFERMKRIHDEDCMINHGNIIRLDISADVHKLMRAISMDSPEVVPSVSEARYIINRSQLDSYIQILKLLNVEHWVRVLGYVEDHRRIKHPMRRLLFQDIVVLEQFRRSISGNGNDVIQSEVFRKGEEPSAHKLEVSV